LSQLCLGEANAEGFCELLDELDERVLFELLPSALLRDILCDPNKLSHRQCLRCVGRRRRQSENVHCKQPLLLGGDVNPVVGRINLLALAIVQDARHSILQPLRHLALNTPRPMSVSDQTHIRNVKQNLDRLDEGDQLLFRVLAATGMRLSEAFEIDGEMKERGCRYIIVGRKTDQSLRRVPLPAALLPFLPRKIEGQLFKSEPRGARAASKRLMRFLRAVVGIDDPRKVVHSLRHRAQDRLRAAGCPEDLRWAILGHEEETVAAGYGEGFPVPLLKRWIDKIGF
jgi:Phage integrase family